MTLGENLWRAAELVSKAGCEINAMHEQLKKRFDIRLNSLGKENENKFVAKYDNNKSENDESGFLALGLLDQWSLIPQKRGRQKELGWLYVQTTIWNETVDNIISPCSCVPRIEVGYSYGKGNDRWVFGSAFDPKAPAWENYCLDMLSCCPAKPKGIWDNGGVKWNDEGIEWYFCIPLFTLKSLEDLDKNIIEPVIKLLNGENPSIIFKGSRAFRFKLENNILTPFEE